ncbi:hypothetical protein ACE1AT_24755, partial [Pelatocladus sp. BLCC-F211]|uniref:hypothetical protein n=1 Tax=Pelatocladus sp. BLCC-F211 TaxID=3342752 RepID=UPI0035BAA11E
IKALLGFACTQPNLHFFLTEPYWTIMLGFAVATPNLQNYSSQSRRGLSPFFVITLKIVPDRGLGIFM